MSAPGGSFIHVYVGHRLLILHVWMPTNGLSDSLDAINGIHCLHMSCRVDRCIGCLSAGQSASMAVPNVMVCYGSTCPQPCCGYSARAVCLAKLSSAASAKTHPWQSRTQRMNEALTTGIP